MRALSIGIPFTMIAGEAYATPAVKTTLYTDDAAPPLISHSNTAGFASNGALLATNGHTPVPCGFIRVTAANLAMILKRA